MRITEWLNPYRPSLNTRMPYILITGMVLLVSAWFLWDVPPEVPNGDSYIHFVYANNLAVHGELTYNLGVSEGIGTSSILWVAVLALLRYAGVMPLVATRWLGVLLLVVMGGVTYHLMHQILAQQSARRPRLIATATTLLFVIPGNMLWHAFSGMETLLFFCLGLLSLLSYAKNKWRTLGLFLGLLTLTRIEGVALAAVILLAELVYQRRVTPRLWKIIVPMFLVILPWLLILGWIEGTFITTSFFGKQVSVYEAQQQIVAAYPELAWLFSIAPLIFLLSWISYALLYMTGIAGLPGAIVNMTSGSHQFQQEIPIIGFVVIALVVIPLVSIALKQLWQQRSLLVPQVQANRLLIVSIAWFAVHNGSYALILPQPGSAGRYALMNHLLFWAALLFGILQIKRRFWKIAAAAATIGLVGASLMYWQTIFTANIDHMLSMRIPAAEYIDEHVSTSQPVGATDLGPIRYYVRQPVVDLGGWVNRDINAFRKSGGGFADYLAQEGICYLMLFNSKGGIGIDYAQAMALRTDPRFELVTLAEFSIPVDTWAYATQVLHNYPPAVSVYRIAWNNNSSC